MICTKCGEIKSIVAFDISPYTKRAFPHCKKCRAENLTADRGQYVKQYNADENNKNKSIQQSLLANYGITLEEYQLLFEHQDGKCAICKKSQDKMSYRLNVDHNHETGEIRGLLCARCNAMVSLVENKKPTIRQIYNYLAKHA